LYKTTNVVTNLATSLPVTNKSDYRGSLLGWVNFTNQTLEGRVSWIKTAETATNYFYPNGFTSTVELIGSAYHAPSNGVRILNMTSGTLVFSGGNLSGSIAWGLNWASNNTINLAGTSKPTVTLTPATGLIKGTFYHPQLGNLKTNFSGTVLQNQNYAAGYFLGTNQSGSILLQGD